MIDTNTEQESSTQLMYTQADWEAGMDIAKLFKNQIQNVPPPVQVD